MLIRWRLLLAATLLTAATTAHADTAGIYLRGHGGYGGASVEELPPGGDEPGLGPVIGGEVGANILLFNAYLNYDRYLDHGSITRGILGLASDLELGGWRLSGRLGAGLMMEKNTLFAGDLDHTGVVARIGAAFDRRVSAGFWIGVGVDAEYFALKPDGDSMVESEVHTGADIFASLRVSFELGI
jgi:hypothetical protein